LFSVFLVFLSCGSKEGDVNSSLPTPYSSLSYKEGELLVKFKKDVNIVQAQSLHKAVGSALKRRFESIGIEHVILPPRLTVKDGLRLYTSRPDVEYAEPNYIVRKAVIPTDTDFNLQWGLNNTGQTIEGITGAPDADIDAPEAWDIHTSDGNVIVGVIDTGVDYNHPDLSANIWINTKEIPDNGLDDDGNGFIDDIRGWNFVKNDNDPMDDDVDGHGTHVAGIIGAVGNNNTGVSGVNWNVKIMPLKFLDSNGEGTIADIIEAINYAVTMGAKVINASYTYPQECITTPSSQAEKDAIKAAGDSGVLFVAAAGNYGCNNDVYPFYPASHPLPNIISVAASDQNDNKPSWSNYGANSVHVAAPGVNIYSTIRTALGSYGYMRGTSMASPFVAGLAGLIASYKPDYAPLAIREAILLSVDQKPSFTNKLLSNGRINAYNALALNLITIPPLAPTYLQARKISNNQIDLTWVDNSSVENNYVVERKTGVNGSYIKLTAQPANTTSYSDTSVNVTEGTAYYYRVKAGNSNGESLYSNDASIITPPKAPSNLTASAVSSSQINLSWTDNSSVEDGFKIEKKAGFAIVGANITAYSDADLSAGTTYYYRVKAYNTAAGDSFYSNEASATTQSPSSGGGGGGCFIATAAYGSYLAPEVQILRNFRDKYLLTNLFGRAFVSFYYRNSPPIANFIRQREALRIAARLALTPVVYVVERHPLTNLALIGFVIGIVAHRRRKRSCR